MKIYIDGAVDVPFDLRNKFTVIPISINTASGESYASTEISPKDVEKLEKPRTSSPSPGDFLKHFNEEGICLTISSKVSASYNAARVASKLVKKVVAFDTGSISVGSGIIAEKALELSKSEEIPVIISELSRLKNRVVVLGPLTREIIEGIEKSGRVSLPGFVWELFKTFLPPLKIWGVVRSDWRVGLSFDVEELFSSAEEIIAGASDLSKAKELAKEYGAKPALISSAYSTFAGSNIVAFGLLLEKEI